MKERGEKQFSEMNTNFCYEKKLYQCHFGYQALKLRIVHYEKLNLKIIGGIKSRTKREKMLELLTFIQFKLYCIQVHLKPGYYILEMINMGVHNVHKEIGDPSGHRVISFLGMVHSQQQLQHMQSDDNSIGLCVMF